MKEEVRALQMKYDALIKARRDIRAQVKDEFREKIKEEIDNRTRRIDFEFALEFAAAKAAGMKRYEIAEAIRTNAHNRMQYFLNLANLEGFQRGRPAAPKPDHNRLGYEIIDIKNMHIKVYSLLGKPVFPFEAELWYGTANRKVLMPVGGDLWTDESVKQFWDYKDTKDWKKLLDEMWDWGVELQAKGAPTGYRTYDVNLPFRAEKLAALKAEKEAEELETEEMPFG